MRLRLRAESQPAVSSLAVALFAFTYFGCALDSSRTITFEASPLNSDGAPLLANSVEVIPLSDERPNDFHNAPELLVFVPFAFSITGYYERPERDWALGKADIQTQQSTDPGEALAKGLAETFASRKLFQSVAYFSNKGADLHLVGKLTSTRVDDVVNSHGLSLAVLVPGILGAPARTWTWHLAFDLQLQEPLTQTILWQKNYRTEHTVNINGLYYRETSSPAYWVLYMLMDLVPAIIRDLEQGLASIKGSARKEETTR